MCLEILKNIIDSKKTRLCFSADFTKTNSALLRMPTITEVGEMCVFLASEKASAITGQCINVDCGVLPQ